PLGLPAPGILQRCFRPFGYSLTDSRHTGGWALIRSRYDDGGYSGGSTERPALQELLADVKAGKIDVIVVYKVDRLTRSLADFAKLVELFDGHGVSFVSVTQQFNTTTSMGRLTLNVLLSFAQFEREVTSERIRDKIAASKRKGLWVGGIVPLGYVTRDRGSHRRFDQYIKLLAWLCRGLTHRSPRSAGSACAWHPHSRGSCSRKSSCRASLSSAHPCPSVGSSPASSPNPQASSHA